MNNSNGTIKRTFKLGPDGLKLISKEILNSTGSLERYRLYIKDNLSEDPNKVLYDTDIPSSAIISSTYSENNETVTFLLKDQTTITLPTIAHDLGGIKGPDTSVALDIAVFSDTTGKILSDGGAKITDAIDSEDANITSKVPNNKAVVDYVGTFSDALLARLKGQI